MKKGFTLIELLAVIVILAIIALIATPIVLNIINDTKESAVIRSADFYLNGVETAIATSMLNNIQIKDGTYEIMEDGNICLEEYDITTKECKDNDSKIDNNELKVKVDGETPKSGRITIINRRIAGLNIVLAEKEISRNSKGEFVYTKSLEDVCDYISGTPKEAGAKYKCKVDPNKDAYTFFVLNTRNASGEIITESSKDKTAVSINLIMDRNINSDGTPVTKAIKESQKDANGGIYNIVPWISDSDYGILAPYDGDICLEESGCVLNDKGPLTAMKFISEATKSWTNTNEMLINSFDNDDTTPPKEMKSYNTYARMPYLNEVGSFDSNKNNGYLFEYLSGGNWPYDQSTKPTNNISGINGYWTLSVYKFPARGAFAALYLGSTGSDYASNASIYGVRPVITLKI